MEVFKVVLNVTFSDFVVGCLRSSLFNNTLELSDNDLTMHHDHEGFVNFEIYTAFANFIRILMDLWMLTCFTFMGQLFATPQQIMSTKNLLHG